MGKHERQLIEEAEKIVEKILNSRSLGAGDKRNPWFNHAVCAAKQIKKDFPNISSTKHLGNRYDNTGDILIISNGKKIFIEIKMSDTKSGVGTKANISQDALTENCLFVGKMKSWSDFRKEKNHNKWVDDYLSKFNRYPQKISKIGNSAIQREEKARYLRNLKRNKKSKIILKDISERDRSEKLEYLNYLSAQKQDGETIKRFFILILLGIHTKEILFELIKEKNFFEEVQNLFVYYANYHKDKIIIRKEDAGDRVSKILNRYSNFKIIFPDGLSHCKIAGAKGDKSEPLLQIVFHWKNVAQGIKTPCLNIFDLTTNIKRNWE
ncbi:MAG: hypothetical protein L6275_00970 [Candidatus Portnoybacteria bacterium]|nr:hypothetical protein [Candidatus Portnoybacteria bacterium]